jgi:transcriptional regulator with XRE-family HTH domain
MTTKSDNNLSFGEFIKAYRQGEELTQVEFAESLGVSKQRLCDIEHNRATVSIKMAKTIAECLDLPKEWLVRLTLQDQLKKEGVDLKIS